MALEDSRATAGTLEPRAATGLARAGAARGFAWVANAGDLPLYVISIAGFIAIWAALASQTKPVYLPPPDMTATTGWELLVSGELLSDVRVSLLRIVAGWLLGSALGVPLGLLMGRLQIVRAFATPYIEFFRYIPPIALISLALLWLGAGEESKVALIIYTTIFIVTVNTMAGALAVRPELLRAARALGANNVQAFLYVIVPLTVPYAITGMSLAMSSSFMTVISAEMLGADTGIGYLIWNSRSFMLTNVTLVGIVAVGVMGFTTDLVFRLLARTLLGKYGVKG